MKLSPAEKQIIEYLANGLTDAQIAAKRGTSISTVRRQIEDARRKLDAVNRTHLVSVALRKNLIR